MTKVLKYLKKYWYFALLTPLFMVLEVSMDLVQPSLMSRIVDEGIVAGDIQLILNLGGQMLIFTVIGCLGGVLSGVFGNMAAQNFSNDLRKDAFAKVMKMSFQQTDKFTIGSLVTRLTNDITACQDFVWNGAAHDGAYTYAVYRRHRNGAFDKCNIRLHTAFHPPDTDNYYSTGS